MAYFIFKKDDDSHTTLVCSERDLGGATGRRDGRDKMQEDGNERTDIISVEAVVLRGGV